MRIKFEHDYQQKIMLQSFEELARLETSKDVQAWRSAWMQELKSWHSPYKALIDCTKLNVADSLEVRNALNLMIKFFEGLFLKSAVGFSANAEQLRTLLPFEVVGTFEEAQGKAGVRGLRSLTAPVDFRSSIQLQNHFAQHVVELSFSEDVFVDSKEKMAALKSKITNNLMQWHSKWSLVIDCSNVRFSSGVFSEWEAHSKYFVGFFMKACVGYSPKGLKEDYPFLVYRARHRAVAILEGEGNFMGNDAHCRSAKPFK
ncbi:MAG: hypothetical protein NTV34_12935 [Proteobacteria bacterium]|nr:hypothetical protein [Pseudomonadota bacterium]